MTGILFPFRTARLVGAVALALAATVWPAAPKAADDNLARSRGTYAALKSYADTGVVTLEYGPAGAVQTERATFKTLYRAPRHFYFELTKNADAGGDRFVVWSDGPAFHTWWAATGTADTYPPGGGVQAFAIAAVPALNAITYIAPWLFAQAGLSGTLTEIDSAVVAGVEQIAGRRCQKLAGLAKSVYGTTGHAFNRRAVTVWVDAETALVRKIVEDGSAEGTAGAVSRSTVVFEPLANPAIDDAQFRFVPPRAPR